MKEPFTEDWTPFEKQVAGALKEAGAYTHTPDIAPPDEARLGRAFLHWLVTTTDLSRPVLHIEGVTFPDPCDLRAYASDHHFEFVDCRFPEDLDLRHLRMRQLIFDRCRFEKTVHLNGAKIEQGIIANNAHFHELVLQAADLGGNLELTNTVIDLPLRAYQLRVGKSLFLRDGARFAGANLANAQIGTHCQFRGASVSGELDLTGAVIGGELQFGQAGAPPISWSEGASLSLRNVRAQTFGARLSDFRSGERYVPVDLAGFTFEGFATANLADNYSLAHESPKELLRWLKASEQASSVFDPKPYFGLAQALERAGQRESARRVRIGLGWRHAAKANISPLARIGQFMSGAFIGFGHAPWKALSLFMLVFLAGMAHAYMASFGTDFTVLKSSVVVDAARISLENSIPLVEFSNVPDRDLCQQAGAAACRTVSNWNYLLFDIQKILSLLLASYFVAAVTGYATTRRTD
ncbi:MAG: hypothetical protein R3C00_12565 [Hyphomonas sp.]|nr:hypothetical protein [Hyphomonas sp.]MCB9970589.1 hypothetical protein [Hyphomonas sp.]